MAAYGSTYDTTVYDSPTFTGTDYAHTNANRNPPTAPPNLGSGGLVTTPPLGTGGPSGPGNAVPRFPGTPTTTPPTTPPATTTPVIPKFDPKNALDWVKYQYDQNKTSNPGLLSENPPEYWAARIAEDNGQHDEAYWAKRMATPTAEYFSGGGGSGATGGGFDLSGFNLGGLFDDPAAAGLMSILGQRINQLTTPINDPNAALVTQAIQDALGRLNTIQSTTLPPLPPSAPIADVPDMSAQFDALIKAIQENTQSTTGPTAQYRGILDKLVSDLSQPAFSEDQLGQLKTAAVDTLNHEHQQALDNKVRALGMQGVPPSSGIAQEALKNVDAQYQTLKAQALQAQNTAEIAMINERRQQLMQAASSGLQASQQQAAQEQAALVAQMNLLMNQRAQNIDVRGQNINAQQISDNRALNERNQNITLRGQDITSTVTGVTLAQALEDLSRGQRQEQNTNLNQAVQYAGIPVDLSSQRLSQALQVLGLGSGSTSPKDLLASLAAIGQLSGTANQTNTLNTSSWWTNIGNLIAGLSH